jgi:aldehyde dehydrogenase (NAD+)
VIETYGSYYIGGDWVDSTSGVEIPVFEAATGKLIGKVADASAAEVDSAVEAAGAASAAWAATPSEDRAALMERLAETVTTYSEKISETVSRENGMPLGMSVMANVGAVSGLLQYYAGMARSGGLDETRQALAYSGEVVLQRKPVGVVAMIVPWNFPLGLTAIKLAPALAAGCTAVIKPSPETSLDAAFLMAAIADAGIPPGVVNLVTGGRETGELLVRHSGVDKVAFTGSTAAGRAIGAICGAALKPVTLELGGKSAAIVLEDADLSEVMAGLGYLSFVNAGQACFLNSRVLAPRSRYAEIVDGLATVAQSFVLGNPLDAATTMGPLVSERQRARVEGYVAGGRQSGARLVTGGGRPEKLDQGWFFEPTVFADVDNAMPIAREEIFGPVVCVIPYDSQEEAIAIANDSDYGLAGTVWSSDQQRALAVAREVDTGTIGLNMWDLDPGAPFGGWKASGMGKEMGPEGLAAYLKVKSINVPAAK